MVLPFINEHIISNNCKHKKMLDFYQASPMFNLVPANFKTWNDNQMAPYSLQHLLDSQHAAQMARKSNGIDYSNYLNRRLVAKSCSDSSMDARSSDSTYTNTSSSGGGGSIGMGGAAVAAAAAAAAAGAPTDNCGGISGRFTRQAVNSRFPAMDRLDLNATYVRVHKPPTHCPGMGAYAQLQQQQYNMNSTYPKVNCALPATQQHRRRSQQHHAQQQLPVHKMKAQDAFRNMESHSKQPTYNNNDHINATASKNHSSNNSRAHNTPDDENLDGTYTISPSVAVGQEAPPDGQQRQQQQGSYNAQVADVGNTVRRFINVEKFIMHSSKTVHVNATPTTPTSLTESNRRATATATSSMSQQSTGRSTAIPFEEEATRAIASSASVGTPATTLVGNLQEHPMADNEVGAGDARATEWINGDEEAMQLEDLVDSPRGRDEMPRASRRASELSSHSKSESINMQLEETPPAGASRAQSMKSLPVDEQLEEAIDSMALTPGGVEMAADESRSASSSFVLVDEGAEGGVASPSRTSSAAADMAVGSGSGSSSGSLRGGSAKKLPSQTDTPKSRQQTPRARSPSIEELKALSRRNSMIKSMESLYERRLTMDPLDNTTESTSSATSSQLISTLPLQLQHTPLKQKAKTTHFLKRDRRRVSPVKQSLKTVPSELYPPTLQRFEKPREGLHKTFDQLDSSNWEVIILGLKSMVRLMRHHPEYLENHMHMVCIQLARAVRNLRSQVARAACQAATELFSLKTKGVEQECDDLVCALLHRTADTNRFIRGDATRALESKCDNLAPTKVLNILAGKGATHANAVVRTTSAKLLNRLVERLGAERVYAMGREQRDKFFVTGANLLLEGSLETRGYAKALFRLLSEHPHYNRLLLEVIPHRTYRNVEKTLKSIR